MANVSLLGLKLGAKIKIEAKWTKSGLLSWQEVAEAPVAGRVSGQWSVAPKRGVSWPPVSSGHTFA